uniref:uncharacterized protein LOC108949689 n=1 Tax=Ciona intestinalis TaxID=7719 RepID=UPI00089DC3CC|nr:uncharacterized protein LOC108949689 [Ciona intestinalis]|eukprot:XP_026691534.1 uncharacterized protein LOC108949689 [Ciona intestinalis]
MFYSKDKWSFCYRFGNFMAEMHSQNSVEPIISVCIAVDVTVSWISFHGWRVDPSHLSLPDIRISTLNYFLEEVMKFKLCEGIDEKYSTRNTKLHHLQNWNGNCLSARTLTRSPLCQVAFLGDEQCSQCTKYQYKSKCNKKYCDRKREVSEEELVDIDDSLHSDFMDLLHSESGDMNEWQQMFFREQIQNSRKSAYCRRYHPDVVRWAIELYSRSPSAYQHLITTDVLKLPSSRTLQKFRNIGTNEPGLNQIAVEAMKNLKFPVEAYLTVDEMKVKESLVYKDGRLVGFVDFGDRYTQTKIATHICMFYIRSLKKEISMPLSWWPTTTTPAYQLASTFWDLVGTCEMNSVHVNAIVADAASVNRKFFNHIYGGTYSLSRAVYTAPNPYRPSHPIFILSDPSHLLKTTRNGLYSSKPGGTKFFAKSGRDILWTHIQNLYNLESKSVLHKTRLSNVHVDLNSYSKMNVSLARQNSPLGCRKGSAARYTKF